MRKKYILEKEIVTILRKVLKEQTSNKIEDLSKGLKFGSGGKDNPKEVERVKKLQAELMKLGLLKTKSMKPTGYFGNMTQSALDRYFNKSQNIPQEPKQQTTGACPSIKNSPYLRDYTKIINAYKKNFIFQNTEAETVIMVDKIINQEAEKYKKQIPTLTQQSACEIASICIRNEYDQKNVFIIDSMNKRIYLFGPELKNIGRKLIAQDIIIDGKHKQRNDAVSVAKAFIDYRDKYYMLLQKTGKVPTEDQVWAEFDKDKTRFMPAGIYTGTITTRDEHYAGEGENLLYIKNWLGKEVGQAVHGYYTGDNRVEFMKKALEIVKNPGDIKQIEDFMRELKQGGLKMDFSYGCINVPPRFVPILRKYGPNSFIFNIAEDNINYLVQNSVEYFDKQMKTPDCLSPEALGAENVEQLT